MQHVIKHFFNTLYQSLANRCRSDVNVINPFHRFHGCFFPVNGLPFPVAKFSNLCFVWVVSGFYCRRAGFATLVDYASSATE